MNIVGFEGFIPSTVPQLQTRSGVVVAVTERGEEERIEVRASDGRLVLEIDPTGGRMTVTAPAGHMSLAAPKGDLDLTAGGAVRIRSRRFSLATEQADIGITLLRGKLSQAKLELGRLETVAGRVVERAKSVFRHAEDVYQQKAGRMRTLVTGGYSLRSHHASLVTDDEVKIDGKQILLG